MRRAVTHRFLWSWVEPLCIGTSKENSSLQFKILHAGSWFVKNTWVVMVCPLGEEATSKASHKLLLQVPKGLNREHSGAHKSPHIAPTYCHPPVRKQKGIMKTSPTPAWINLGLFLDQKEVLCVLSSPVSLTCVLSNCFSAPGLERLLPKTSLARKTNEGSVFSS